MTETKKEVTEIAVVSREGTRTARAELEPLSPGQAELMRWYFEVYPELREATTSGAARTAEEELGRLQSVLQGKVLDTGAGARTLEIHSRSTLPWELLDEAGTRSVVRRPAMREARVATRPPRILWVIARPHGPLDIPFCTVASAVLGSLPESIRVDCLRPPTVEELDAQLARAAANGEPYDIVHFDGHGGFSPGVGGWLEFAVYGSAKGTRVDGATLGRILAAHGVTALLMNACRSAFLTADGSLAEQVVAQGIPACLGMAYAIFPAAARLFFSAVYQRLAEGEDLETAVSQGRGRLRQEGSWHSCVPVLYSASHVAFAPTPPAPPLEIAPMVSRDALIAELEEAFSRSHVVLLYGEPGAGKTTSALAFRDWFRRTGGCSTVMFTSFQNPPTLAALEADACFLNKPGQSSLWIWDNCETASGKGQEYLAALARLAGGRAECCRVLVTSRRDETGWLPEAGPARVTIPKLSPREMRELAAALARPLGLPLDCLPPLIAFSAGNPLVLRAVSSIAAREGVRSAEAAQGLAASLLAAETQMLPGTESSQWSRLDASFAWTLDHSFDNGDRAVAGALILFGSAFPPACFRWLVSEENENAWPLAKGRGTILERAEETGLISQHGELCWVHPAARWHLRKAWEEVPEELRQEGEVCFVHAMAQYARWRVDQRDAGMLAGPLDEALEDCLLGARRLARQRNMFPALELFARVLGPFFGARNRVADYQSVFEDMVDDYLDPESLAPRAGREGAMDLILAFLEGEAQRVGDRERSRVLHARHVEMLRERRARGSGDAEQNTRNLASALKSYGYLLRECKDPAGLAVLEEAFALLAGRQDVQRIQADIACDLAEWHRDLTQDFETARVWASVAESWRPAGPGGDRARTELLLGGIELRRAGTGEAAAGPLEQAAYWMTQARSHAPAAEWQLLAWIDMELGMVRREQGDWEAALTSYESSWRLWTQGGERQLAAMPLAGMAQIFQQQGRRLDAKRLAQSAFIVRDPLLPADEEWNKLIREFLMSLEADSAS